MPQQEGKFLDEIVGKRKRRRVFRLALVLDGDFAKRLGFDEQSTEELRQNNAAASYTTGLSDLLDNPFRRKFERSRFSDGSFPVFYSSLDTKTAEAESKYHLPRYAGRPKHSRTMFYRRFSCRFEGIEKDLRPKLGEWPDLIHSSDYTFCNRLGEEAQASGVDGILAPSARRSEGTNLPVFRRGALHDPEEGDLVSLALNMVTNEVTLAIIDDSVKQSNI